MRSAGQHVASRYEKEQRICNLAELTDSLLPRLTYKHGDQLSRD